MRFVLVNYISLHLCFQRKENGFEVIDAGIQIFEKKVKKPKPEESAAVT
ncbi:hypothetical protein H6G27_15605 [Nostoc linckia FACHB-104]|nr:hypothetical protein [Nostoc linckia FACHB-104]